MPLCFVCFSEGRKEARAYFFEIVMATVERLVFLAVDVCVCEERAELCFVQSQTHQYW